MPIIAPPTPSDVLATATAPGKVILLGEHAVVHGQPALAVPCAAVAARAVVHAAGHPCTIRAHFPDGDDREPLDIDLATAAPDVPLAAAALAALEHAGRTARTPWAIEITSTVPCGRGLGSSAAVAVALVQAIGRACGTAEEAEWDEATVAALSFAAERLAHGTPSGIDNTVIAFGHPIRFAHGEARRLAVGAPLTLLVADSGDLGSTRAAVAGVRARYEARPVAYGDWFRRIGHLVDEASTAIAGGSVIRLGWFMNANHLILQAMEVSTPRLDTLVAAARQAGALGAKLSGAGGGGVVVALATPETAAGVRAALHAAGAAAVWETRVA